MKTLRRLSLLLVIAVVATGLAACSEDDETITRPDDHVMGCDSALVGAWGSSAWTMYYESFTFDYDGTFVLTHRFTGNGPYSSYYYGTYAAAEGVIEMSFTSRSYVADGQSTQTDFDDNLVRGTYSIDGNTLSIDGIKVPNNNSVPINDEFTRERD